MGIAVAQENSPSPWLPQNLGLRMTQATFPGTQGSKDWNLLGTGHHLQPEVTPHLTSSHPMMLKTKRAQEGIWTCAIFICFLVNLL